VLRRVVHVDAVVMLVEHRLLLLLWRILVARAWSHIGHHSILHPLHMVVIELLLHLLLRELLRQQCRGLLGRWLCLVDALGRLRTLGRLMVLVVLSNGRSVSFRLTRKFRLVEVVGVCRFGQLRIGNGQGTRGASRVYCFLGHYFLCFCRGCRLFLPLLGLHFQSSFELPFGFNSRFLVFSLRGLPRLFLL
jgi:hypothetical protein